jgi:hypothetical protein
VNSAQIDASKPFVRRFAVVVGSVLALVSACARPPAPETPLPAHDDLGPLDEEGWLRARDRAVRAWEGGAFGTTMLAVTHDEAAPGVYMASISRVRIAIDGGADVELDHATGWVTARPIAPGWHAITVRTRLTGWCVYCSGLAYEVKRSFEVEIAPGTAALVRVALRRHGGVTVPLEEALALDVEARAWRRISSPDGALGDGLRAIDAAIDRVTAMLEEARRRKDIILVTCTNDKLAQLRVARTSAIDRAAMLEQAMAAGDVARATHERTVLMILRQRADRLLAEAESCI